MCVVALIRREDAEIAVSELQRAVVDLKRGRDNHVTVIHQLTCMNVQLD